MFYPLSKSFLAGILIAGFQWEGYFIFILLLFLLLFIVLKISDFTRPDDLSPCSALLFLLVLIIAIGYYRLRLPELPKDLDEPVLCRYQVKGRVRRRGREEVLIRVSEPAGCRGAYLLQKSGKGEILGKGKGGEAETVRVATGSYFQASIHFKPFEKAGLVGDFDEETFYRSRGIAGLAQAEDLALLEEPPLPARLLEAVREAIRSRLDELPGDCASFLGRLVLGRRPEGGEDRLAETMEELGVSHLLAASGLHVSLFFSWGLLALSRLMTNRKAADILLIAFLLGYAGLLEFPPSIMRAVAYLAFSELAKLSFRRMSSARRWVYCACLLLIVRPYAILDPAFQLSFACGSAMEAVRKLNRINPVNSAILSSFRLSFWVNLFILPILLPLTDGISLKLFLANLILVPLFEGLFVLGLLTVLTGPMVILSGMIQEIFCLAYRVFSLIASGLLVLPLPKQVLPKTANPAFLFSYSLLLILVYSYRMNRLSPIRVYFSDRAFLDRRARLRTFREALRLSGLLLLSCLPVALILPGPARLTMLYVGQGDAFLLQKGRTALLFDTGGKAVRPGGENIQGEPLAEELNLCGVDRLNGVFLSHRDYDHTGNLPELAARIPIDRIYLSSRDRGGCGALLDPALELKEVNLSEGDRINFDGVSLKVLAGGDFFADQTNDRSMVLRLESDFSLLLMGDMEGGETAFIGDGRFRRPDILKMGHHGAEGAGSGPFLDWSQPSLVLISAGYENRYGHPHPATLSRLKERKIPYCRSDLQGGILVYTDILGRLRVVKKRQGSFPISLSSWDTLIYFFFFLVGGCLLIYCCRISERSAFPGTGAYGPGKSFGQGY